MPELRLIPGYRISIRLGDRWLTGTLEQSGPHGCIAKIDGDYWLAPWAFVGPHF